MVKVVIITDSGQEACNRYRFHVSESNIMACFFFMISLTVDLIEIQIQNRYFQSKTSQERTLNPAILILIYSNQKCSFLSLDSKQIKN